MYDHGARNRNPVSTLWYGIDPLFEKYPDFSPYNYCAGNPVKLVDPDGRDSYYNIDGVILAKTSSGSDRYVVTNNTDIKSVKKYKTGNFPTLNEEPFKLPSDAVLSEGIDVLERTFASPNNGLQEENSLVKKDKTVIKGLPGEAVTRDSEFGNAVFPYCQDKENVEASIYSHNPAYFTWSGDGKNSNYRVFDGCDIPSSYDKNTFKDYNQNIIVGRKGKNLNFNNETGVFSDSRKVGFAFYGQNITAGSSPNIFIEYKAICKIIGIKPKRFNDLEVKTTK